MPRWCVTGMERDDADIDRGRGKGRSVGSVHMTADLRNTTWTATSERQLLFEEMRRPMDKTKCITEEEFDRWVRNELASERVAHLDSCDACRALGDQLRHFDQTLTVRKIVGRLGHSGVPVNRYRWTVGSLISLVAGLSVLAFAQREGLRDRGQAMALFQRNAADANTALAEKTTMVFALKDQLANITLPADKAKAVQDLFDKLLTSESQSTEITVARGALVATDIDGTRTVNSLAAVGSSDAAMAKLQRVLVGRNLRFHGPKAETTEALNTTLNVADAKEASVTCAAFLSR